MKRIATKVAKRLQKHKSQKIIDLSTHRQIRDQTIAELSKLNSVEKLIEDGYDVQHAIYSHAQNYISFLAEGLLLFPEFNKMHNILSIAEEKYMPSWPPMSPISKSHYCCWCAFDLSIGIDKETLTSCLIDLSDILFMGGDMVNLLHSMNLSRIGIYKVISISDNKLLLEELFTKKQFLSKLANNYVPAINELLLLRLLPPVHESIDYYTVFTSPYVLRAKMQEWINFFERNIKGVRGTDSVDKNYHVFMKKGLSSYYWLEYIMQSYYSNSDDAIFLYGIPDIASSRPHYHDNNILPEKIVLQAA